MNILSYRRAKFQSFGVRDEYTGEEQYENSVRELPRVGVAWTYVCPHCIEELGLDYEAGLDYATLSDMLRGNPSMETNEYICCVLGCDGYNAMEISFEAHHCELEKIYQECV